MKAPTVNVVTAPGGVAHTADTVKRMALLARDGAHSMPVRAMATRIVHNVPGKDTRGEIAAIYKWVRDNIRYRFDPVDLEWVQAPHVTLQERAGDCDDMTVLILALLQSIGHRTQLETSGPTRNVQKHVYATAWDGTKWIGVDPVLEPRQPTTAPRTDLGAFGRRAPGVRRVYDDKGQPMSGTKTNGKAIAKQLWRPTAWERRRLRKPRVAGAYRGAGMPNVKPIRLALWNNAYDPGDLGALGFNFAKAIGSVAKVAKIAKPFASFIPGGSAAITGLEIAGKLTGGKAKPKAAGAAPAAPASSAPASVRSAPAGYAPSRADSGGASSLAPLMSASVQVSRDAIAALERQQDKSLRAVMQLATGAQAARTDAARTDNKIRLKRASTDDQIRLRASAAPKAPARKRQRWDPKTRRWIVYQERKPQALSGFRPHLSLSFSGVETFNADSALALASRLAADIRSKGRNYSRKLAQDFQRAAGLDPDGYYGGASAGALRYFTRAAPPKPLFAPLKEKQYAPPSVTRQAAAPVVITAPLQQITASAPTSAPRQVASGSRAVTSAPARPAAPPVVIRPQPMTRRDLAQAMIDAVRQYIAKNRKPPVGAFPGVITYQRAASLKADGKYGPKTRAAAARDLGVSVQSLPATAYDAAPRAPARAPASSRPVTPSVTRAPSPAPQSSAPVVIYDPIATERQDPGLPRLDDVQPTEATPALAPRNDDKTLLYVAAAWWWLQGRKRRGAAA